MNSNLSLATAGTPTRTTTLEGSHPTLDHRCLQIDVPTKSMLSSPAFELSCAFFFYQVFQPVQRKTRVQFPESICDVVEHCLDNEENSVDDDELECMCFQ